MQEELSIVAVEQPGQAEWTAIGQGISEYNALQAGDDSGQPICFILRAPDGSIVGGLMGETHYDWFYVNLMWIEASRRGKGYGHRLLTLAEEEARSRGARNAYLDTFSFQAPGFYQKHGYEVFGELHDFPPGHQRYYLTKAL